MNLPDDVDTVVLFDLDGTLYDGHTWPDLHEIHDVDKKKTDQLLDAFSRDEISFEAWLAGLASEWGEPREKEMDAYVDGMSFSDTARELVSRYEDAYTMMISGALDYVSKQVAEELGIDGHVPTVSLAYDDKDDFVGFDWELYHEKEMILPELDDVHVIVYGNGWNDTELVKGADEAYMVPNDDRVSYEEMPAYIGTLEEFLEVNQNGDG